MVRNERFIDIVPTRCTFGGARIDIGGKIWTPMSQFDGATVIIPAISLGNVPQLAVDLLIHTLDCKLVQQLDDFYLYPFISPVDYPVKANVSPKPGVLKPLEVYWDQKTKTAIIQQRSPVIGQFMDRFVDEVVLPFINPFSRVFVLDLSDAGLFEKNKQIDLIHSDDLSQLVGSLSLSDEGLPQHGESPLSDFTKSLQRATVSDTKPSGTLASFDVYLSYVYEGDNLGDAADLAKRVCGDVLHVDILSTEFITPVSWQGVYGSRPMSNAMEDGLYG